MNRSQSALNDLASLATNALGAARVAGEEVKTAAQSRAKDVVAGMDLASQDELEAVKALALSALEKIDTLEARIAELEKD